MRIVKLAALSNGAHQNHGGDGVTTVPDGWAMIPEGFPVPDTFPFVDIEAEELTCYREVERTRTVTKTREVEALDGEGNTVTEEYEEEETCTEQVPYTVMTVTAMTPGIVPEPEPEPEPEPALDERNRADIDYLAIMMGVEL